jgi:hypothetical protein
MAVSYFSSEAGSGIGQMEHASKERSGTSAEVVRLT